MEKNKQDNLNSEFGKNLENGSQEFNLPQSEYYDEHPEALNEKPELVGTGSEEAEQVGQFGVPEFAKKFEGTKKAPGKVVEATNYGSIIEFKDLTRGVELAPGTVLKVLTSYSEKADN